MVVSRATPEKHGCDVDGTGSAIFVSFNDMNQAEAARKKFPNCILVKSLKRSPLMQIIE